MPWSCYLKVASLCFREEGCVTFGADLESQQMLFYTETLANNKHRNAGELKRFATWNFYYRDMQKKSHCHKEIFSLIATSASL